MAAGTYNLTIDRESSYSMILYLYTDSSKTVRKDLTNWGASIFVRPKADSSQILWSEVSNASGITISNPTGGTINILIPATETTLLQGVNVYNVKIYDTSGTVERILEGNLTINP